MLYLELLKVDEGHDTIKNHKNCTLEIYQMYGKWDCEAIDITNKNCSVCKLHT